MYRTLVCKRLIWALVVFGLLTASSSALWAQASYAPAGSTVGNEAVATYEDSLGKTRSIASNRVNTIVQQVAAVLITEDNARTAAGGAQVIYPHTVENTGNGPDTFDLSWVQGPTSDFLLLDVAIYKDLNQDGMPDDTTPITETSELAPFAHYGVVIVGTVPEAVIADQVNILTITAPSRFDPTVSASNTDTTTATGNAAVNVTKSMNENQGPSPSGPYTLTLTYTNNGNDDAENLTITDEIPDGFTYVPESGRWSVYPDTPLNDGPGGDPPGIEYDYNVTASTTVTAVIESVPVGATATLTFQVNVDADLLAVTIHNHADYNFDDGTGQIEYGTTNIIAFTIPAVYGVTIVGETIESTPQSGTVTFTNVVTNTGNVVDHFEIELDNTSFPTGTSFKLYYADGVTPLITDNHIPCTDIMQPGESKVILLKATLPGGYSGTGPFVVTKTAVSENDPTEPPVEASADDTLNQIVAASVDLTNDVSIAGGATAADGLGHGPEPEPVVILHGKPGDTVRFTLYVNNTSALAETYRMDGSTDKTFKDITVPPGVTVTFRNQSGVVIVDTGEIQPGGSMLVYADITIPEDATPQTMPGYFRCLGTTTGAYDIKTDAVMVDVVRAITLVPDGTGTAYPGDTIVYTHTITNDGNVIEGDALASTTTLTLADDQVNFGSLVYWDKNNNGVLDSEDVIIADLAALVGGTNGASTEPGLDPGEMARLFVQVACPDTTAAGVVNVTTLTAITTQGSYSVVPPTPRVALDTTTIIPLDVTIEKYQSLDAECDGIPDFDWQSSTITTGAIPGSCIRYKVVIKNTGNVDAKETSATDRTPDWTYYTDGDGSTSPTGVACYTTDGGKTYKKADAPPVGSSGDIVADLKKLKPGEEAIIYFGVKILPLP